MKFTRSLIVALVAALPLACSSPPDADGRAGTVADTAPDANGVSGSGDGAVAAPRTFAPAVAGDPMKVVVHKLANGLTVLLSENHEEPRFDAWITTRTGSHKDPAATTGLAHYLEHMLFKGTSKLGTTNWEAEKPHLDAITRIYDELFETQDPAQRKALYQQIDEHNQAAGKHSSPNEFDQLYDRWGGQGLNAFTSNDQTSYVINLPSNRLESWAALESHRFADPVFRLFQTEIEAVYEEKNRAMDNKGRVINEAFMEAMFPGHTYGTQSTLGHTEHLKNPKISAMYDYFHKWYVPGNMVIALAGDFDTAKAIEVIERRFGAWPAKPVPADPQFPLTAPTSVKRVEVSYDAEEALMLGFLTVPETHADRDALVLCDMMLDNSQTGLINRNISQKQLARSAGCGPMMMTFGGAQTFHGVPLEGQSLEDLEALLLTQVAKLKAGEFTEEDLDAVITDFEMTLKQGLESNNSRVRMMTETFILQQPWEHKVHELDRMRALSREDVMAVAKRYFGDNYVSVYRRQGETEVARMPKPPFTPIPIVMGEKSTYFNELAAVEVAPLEPYFVEAGRDFSRHECASGRLYHVVNPMNDLFSLTFTFPIGTDDDAKLSTAFQLSGLAGAGDLDPVSYKRKLYALGSSIGGGAGRQECTISISGLDANLEATLQLMRDHYTRPSGVGQPEVENLVGRTLGFRKYQKQEAPQINGALISFARYGGQSPLLTAPTNEELEAYTADDLMPRLAGLFTHHRKMSYIGTRSAKEIQALVDGLESNTKLVKDDGYQPLKHVVNDKNRILFVDKKTNQSTVTLLGPDGNFDAELAPEVLAYNEYMSGSMGSVVFQEVRESRALAYTAWTNYRTPNHALDENIFTGALGTQTDKTLEAISVLVGIVRDMPAQPTRFAQVQAAKDEHYRASRIGFRAIAGVAQTWEDQGLAGDPRPYNWESIRDMKFEEMQAFAMRMKELPLTITIVGDKSKIDMVALAQFGEVIEMQPDQLFNW